MQPWRFVIVGKAKKKKKKLKHLFVLILAQNDTVIVNDIIFWR